MKNEVLLEQSASKQLRQERDDAMREAARQEGKTLALLGQLEEVRGELVAQRNPILRIALQKHHDWPVQHESASFCELVQPFLPARKFKLL